METSQTKQNSTTLSKLELRHITGGCVGPFCMGQVFNAWEGTQNFFSGLVNGLADGFVDGAKAGSRNN